MVMVSVEAAWAFPDIHPTPSATSPVMKALVIRVFMCFSLSFIHAAKRQLVKKAG